MCILRILARTLIVITASLASGSAWSADDRAQARALSCRAVFAGIGKTAYPNAEYYLGVTAGTAASTTRLFDTIPGPEPMLGNQGPRYLTSLRNNSRVVFSLGSPIHGRELYATDGTKPGTRLVKDIVPGLNGSTPIPLAGPNSPQFDAVAGSVLFRAGQNELWTTNGTTAGTVRLFRPVAPAYLAAWRMEAKSGIRGLLSANDRTVAGKSIWITDGTAAGTRRLIGRAMGSLETVAAGALGGSRFVFRMGSELYVTDGTVAGTKRVTTLTPQTAGPMVSFPSKAVALFTGYTARHGQELWRTDGTAAGTYVINIARDTTVRVAGSQPRGFAQLGSLVYFIAEDTKGVTGIWRTDGTRAGTAGVLTGAAASGQRMEALFPVHGQLLVASKSGSFRLNPTTGAVQVLDPVAAMFGPGVTLSTLRLSGVGVLMSLDRSWRIALLSNDNLEGIAVACRQVP